MAAYQEILRIDLTFFGYHNHICLIYGEQFWLDQAEAA